MCCSDGFEASFEFRYVAAPLVQRGTQASDSVFAPCWEDDVPVLTFHSIFDGALEPFPRKPTRKPLAWICFALARPPLVPCRILCSTYRHLGKVSQPVKAPMKLDKSSAYLVSERCVI